LKRLFASLLFISLVVAIQAQKPKVMNEPNHDDKWIHFGFCLGLNTMDFRVHQTYRDTMFANVSKLTPGFHIQIVSNLRLGNYFDLRFLPGISFGQRDLFFFDESGRMIDDNHRLESNYLEFPLLIKYKSTRINNYRAYLVSGLNPRIDLAKTYEADKNIYMDLKNLDLFWELGFGLDFYLPYFKFTTEIKYGMGMFDALNRRETEVPAFQNSIQRLNSNVVMVSFFFE
jgi:hypothetical protein